MLKHLKSILVATLVAVLLAVGLSACNEGVAAVDFDEPELTMPENNHITYYVPESVIDAAIDSDEFGIFTVKAPRGSDHFYILMKEITPKGEEKCIGFFVDPGKTAEVAIPYGSYYIYDASGEKWYGEEHFFGPDTAYSKSDEVFEFNEEDWGWELELSALFGGNLDSEEANPSDFE